MIIFVTDLAKGEVSGYLGLHSVLKLYIVFMNHYQRPNNSPYLSLSYLHHPRFWAISYFLEFAEFSRLEIARYFTPDLVVAASCVTLRDFRDCRHRQAQYTSCLYSQYCETHPY